MAEGRDGTSSETGLVRETTPFLTSDLFSEILSWLPVKSVIVLKSVCKEWKSLIEDTRFIQKHKKRASTIILFRDPRYFTLWSNDFYVVCSSEGLVLEKKYSFIYRIKNPATRQVLLLPDPVKTPGTMYFIYVSESMVYKLIHMYAKEWGSGDLLCEVLTVGDDLAWRGLNIPMLKGMRNRRVLANVNDSGIFYFVKIAIDGLADPEITVLNLVTECVYCFKIPKKFFGDWNNVYDLTWKGKLSLTAIVEDKLIVRVLEDYKINQWADREIIIPLTSAKDLYRRGDKVWVKALSGSILYIIVNNISYISYDIEEKKVKGFGTIPTFWYSWYKLRPCLVQLKGMQAEESIRG